MSSRTLQRQPRSRSTEPTVESPSWHIVAGIVFLMAALCYLLALISYDPADIPAWCHLAISDTPTIQAHNLMGRLGAVLGGYTFWMFGGANYVIPMCLIWFGINKLTTHAHISLRAWIGFTMMVASAAAILYLQTLWKWENKNVTPYGAGGGLGYVLGGTLLVGILGEAGSLISLTVSYLTGMIFVTGLHPVQLLIHIKTSFIKFLEHWWDRRKLHKLEAEERALRSPDMTASDKIVAPRRRKSVMDDFNDSDLPSASNKPQQLELPPVQPLPKIIDSSSPKTPKAKPQLAEVWQKRQEQKDERIAFAPPTSLTARFKAYKMPPLDLLAWPEIVARNPEDEVFLRVTQQNIIKTLATFGINVTAGDITKGPAITRYEVYPSEGLRVSRIANLEPDIARATRAERINILAPIPGKDTVGIELPNLEKVVVPIRELLEDEAFQNGKSKIPIALGKDVYGKAIIADLATMPHLLVAGATGSGKSVCINSIITSLLCRFAPDELRFIMIDPKVVEMQGYRDLPHLALPVVTDPKLALLALRWVVNEMEKRYQIFAHEGCRNFDTFNARKANSRTTTRVGAGNKSTLVSAGSGGSLDPDDEPDFRTDTTDPSAWAGHSEPPPRKNPEIEIPDSMPYIVVIVDELADLMQTAPADIEVAIARIAQKARAAGIHLILATQTPRADVVTGIIKANVPCRIAFQVASALDSRVILDRKGADRLVGKGDMLYLPPGTSQLIRAQGTMVTDDEIQGLVNYSCRQGKPVFEATLQEHTDDEDAEDGDEITPEDEAILERVLDVIRTEKKASTSLIQRRLRLGYTRAARMMDMLEDRGIIGPGDGAKPREILVEL